MSTASDPRLGLPSASGAARWSACPGSHLAEASAPYQESDAGADAAYGTNIHSLIERYLRQFGTDVFVPLPDPNDQSLKVEGSESDDLDLITRMVKARNDLVRIFFPYCAGRFDDARFEDRLWIRDSAWNLICSGQLDYVLIWQNRILLIDWKSGRGEVEQAAGNPQLRVQAVCAYQEFSNAILERYPEIEIGVAIVQPYSSSQGAFTHALYEGKDVLRYAEARVIQDARLAVSQGQPRIPGLVQCKYCRNKANCPEAAALTAMIPAMEAERTDWMDRPVTGSELDLYRLAEKIIESRKAKARAQLKRDPDSIPGYALKETAGRKEADPVVAWAKVGINIGGAAFAEACKVSIPTLADKWATQRGIPKTKARKEVEEILEHANGIASGKPTVRLTSVSKD